MFKDLTDENLIVEIKLGNKDAEEYLIRKYKKIVSDITRSYFAKGSDKDDLLQEGMIALYKAINDYSDDKNTLFKTYASVCIKNHIINVIRKSIAHKNEPLNEYLELDEVEMKIRDNPESILVAKDYLQYLENSLSSLELKVLDMYLEGSSYKDIAKKLNKQDKAIDNALQRIKTKLKNIMKNEEQR